MSNSDRPAADGGRVVDPLNASAHGGPEAHTGHGLHAGHDVGVPAVMVVMVTTLRCSAGCSGSCWCWRYRRSC